jgi:hypothetical protein
MPDFEGISALTQRECYQAGLEVGIARVAGIPEGVKTALSEAVAAIHFTDSSDYLPALFAVVKALSPTTYHCYYGTLSRRLMPPAHPARYLLGMYWFRLNQQKA